ncbi:polynucleotide adenylyltransferase [Salvia divinorum]|uniref:polynucleotide adenylyltransferase n=1 Tax=Salvia divinorum TaxID=28513 RepID=A0ABD1G0Z3_SALDI
MENNEISYETLTPLAADESPPPPPPASCSPDIEPYVVLRNHISLSTTLCPSPESIAPDYFSLDVSEAVDKLASISATPPPSRDAGPTSAPAPDRTLEGSWFRANSRFKSPMLRLHKDILDFCEFLSPTAEEQESRNAAIKSVFDVINYIWPNAVAEVFGSFETGLYLPSSDIDVVILGSNVRTPLIGLQALSRALSQRGIAKKMQVIAKARIPIIKFVEKQSGFSFDISFDVHNGPKAAEFIKDAVSTWPPLKPLCLILKVFLQQRELNEVYTGGIGSYALLSMLIAMLRTQRDIQTSPECNLGVLLVNFFDLYGCKLNTADVGISCNGECIFFEKYITGFSVEGRPTLIAIEDPQAPDNDIGKSSFNYYQARSAFAMAFTTLTNAKTIQHLGNGEPLERLNGDHQEIYCNRALNDLEEESLPRGGRTPGERKRTASRDGRSSKKAKGHATPMADSHKNGSV